MEFALKDEIERLRYKIKELRVRLQMCKRSAETWEKRCMAAERSLAAQSLRRNPYDP